MGPSMRNRLAPIQNEAAIGNGLNLLALVLAVVVLILPG